MLIGFALLPNQMKKQDFDHQKWLAHRDRKNRIIECNRKRLVIHRHRFGKCHAINNEHNTGAQEESRSGVYIKLPPTLDLDENYEKTVTHFRNVRRGSQRQLKLKSLNFDDIEHISPSAALLLASEVDKWNQSISWRLKASHSSWKPQIKRLLYEMGYFELLHIKKPTDLAEIKNTRFLKFIRGEVNNKRAAGELAKSLRIQIENASGCEIKRHLLFDGLSEAITNVTHHAYKSKSKRMFRMWWMAGAFDSEKNLVTITFYDHGRGIPNTLPASRFWEKLKHNFSSWNDGQKIMAAMQAGRSSTGRSERGKGLQNFLEIIKSHTGSILKIYSFRGCLIVKNNENTNALEYFQRTHTNPIQGTLIEWSFSPEKAIDEN